MPLMADPILLRVRVLAVVLEFTAALPNANEAGLTVPKGLLPTPWDSTAPTSTRFAPVFGLALPKKSSSGASTVPIEPGGTKLMAVEFGRSEEFPSCGPPPQFPSVPILDGLVIANGPKLMLIQLLPSSTVAAGIRLKMGFGTVASAIPGGT